MTDTHKKTEAKPVVGSIADMVSQSKSNMKALKKGKSAGITNDFGSASLLLGDLNKPNSKQPQALELGASLFGEHINRATIEEIILSVAKLCETEHDDETGPIPGRQVIGTYVHDGTKHYLYTEASDAEESATQLGNIISTASNNGPTT